MYDTIVCGVSRAESGRYAAHVAHELARTFGATLHLVMAFKPSEPANVAGADEPPERREAEQFLAQLCDAAVDPPRTHAVPGDPAAAILQVAGSAAPTSSSSGTRECA